MLDSFIISSKCRHALRITACREEPNDYRLVEMRNLTRIISLSGISLGMAGNKVIFQYHPEFLMIDNPVLLRALMQLPEAERFEIAMAVLDQSSPSAVTEGEITLEAAKRQDELESGTVRDIGYDELLAGLAYRPSSPAQ